MSNNFGPIYDTKLLCKEVKLKMRKEGLFSYIVFIKFN